MISYHVTVFAATDAGLDAEFPGWRRPLDALRQEETINPFTREPMIRRTWDPGPAPDPGSISSLKKAGRRPRLPTILPPAPPADDDDEQTRDDRWNQEAAPPRLRGFPRFRIFSRQIHPLRCLVEAMDGLELPPSCFVDCREVEGCIEALPAALTGRLAEIDDGEARSLLADWRARLGFGQPGGVEGSDLTLRRFRALASEAKRSGGHLLYHSEID